MRADWPQSIHTLAERVQERSFAKDKSSGFILERVRNEFFEARYIERYEFHETIEDPFGNELTFDRLEFRQTLFRATSAWPGLELVDAPRSSQSLLSQLLELTRFELSVTPLNVDILLWAESLQEVVGIPVVIDSIQLGALHIDEGVNAKIILKGEKDVRTACKELTGGRTHTVEKIQCRILQGDLRSLVLLSNNAAVKIEGAQSSDEILAALRASLPRPLFY
ncbi:hypothetical protein [Zoogloea sp. LCSB751]|uniref:hypothetical protein n=1 Tax=Zoogloea sp. LCSB751 TaxID=1965277 RepID=UPI0011177C43|nr:hypothetical protein [Zoogloea sp. LCSB751]